MSDEQILLREDKDGIARLTMNRPGALSALSDAMIAALGENLAALQADPAIRAIILAGSGKAFCAGHDLPAREQAGRQAPDAGRAYFADLFGRCAALMLQIRA